MKEEQIRNAINNMDSETAKDALALLLDAGVRSGVTGRSKVADTQEFKNFAQAISYLKQKYKFSELESFTTEADLVYVSTGDRKVLLTKMPGTERRENTRFQDIASESSSEDAFFANAWEPVQKTQPKKDERNEQRAVQSDDGTALTHDTAPSSDGEKKTESSTDKPQHGGGRFSNLEL